MILTDILDFLEQRGFASLTEIAHAVGSPPDAVHTMLQTLERKKRIHRLRLQDSCSTRCRNCAQGAIEVYGAEESAPVRRMNAARCADRSR